MNAQTRTLPDTLACRLVGDAALYIAALRRRGLRVGMMLGIFFAVAGAARAAAPTDIALTSATINQSAATAGATIGTLSSVDADVGDTHTYTLVAGTGSTNNASFAIAGSNLVVGGSALVGGSYSVRIRTTDTTAGTYEEAFTITVTDNVQPTVLGVAPPLNGYYPLDAFVNFTVLFSESVTVNTLGGTPRIAVSLDTGGTVYANYFSGSGTNSLVFRYVVANGQVDTNGINLGGSIDLNGGTIRDAASNNAVLTLNGVGTTSGVLIDGVPPVVTSVVVPANGTYKIGDVLNFTVNYSKIVYVNLGSSAPRFAVTFEGGVGAYATYVSGTGSQALNFSYAIVAGDLDNNGIVVAASIDPNGSVIRDTAANIAVAALNNVAPTSDIRVDAVAPAVQSVFRTSATPTRATSLTFDVTFTELVGGVDLTDFILTKTGTLTGSLSSITANGPTGYLVTVTGVGGDGVLGLEVKGTGTGIGDSFGNALTAGFTTGQTYTVDNVPPTVVVSAPSVTTTETGPVTYTLTYGSADAISLVPANVTLQATGTATATIDVSGTGLVERTVTLSNISGAGTLGISLAAGTATDLAGNPAAATPVSGTFTVNQSPVVAVPIPAQSVGYRTPFTYVVPAGTFTDPNSGQTLTYAATGMPTGITFDPATRAFAGTAPIGSAQITVTATDNGVPARSASSTFTLSIIKAVLTVTAESKTRTYGVANPSLSVVYSGFVAGETLATSGVTGTPGVSVQATATSSPGTYPITATVGTLAADNYSFVFVPGVLTVTKAPLVVKADNLSRVYNSINPTLTFSVTGLVNGESVAVLSGSPTLSTEVTAVSNVGTYPIVLTLGTLSSANYAFTSLENGTFTVLPAPVTITLEGLSKIYSGQPQGASASTNPSGNRVKFTYNGNAALPTDAGTYTVVATSDDPNFAGTATGTLTIAKASQTLTFNPPSTAAVGVPVTLTASASSGLPVTFALVSGNATLTGSSLTLADAAPVTVRAIQLGNTNYNTASVDRTISANERLSQSIVVTAPGDQRTDAAPFALQASATSGLPVTIALQSGPALLSGNIVTLTGSVGTVVLRLSQAGNGTFAAAPDVTVSFNVTLARNDRIINLSSRSRVATETGVLITGFVIGGNAPKQVLIRGIGPSLTQFGVQGAMSRPTVRLYRDATLISENTGWTTGGNAAVLSATFTRLGAFPLETTAADSALLVTLQPGGYSVHVSGGVGVALAEIYDASANPQAESQRLVNISVRNEAGSGDQALIGGFVISGTTPKRVLIRGVGPTLAAFGVTTALADTQVRVFAGQTQIGENDNWSAVPAEATAVAEAAQSVGAFALPAGSKDAALVLTLAPGGYTLQVSSTVAGVVGEALIEVYELP